MTFAENGDVNIVSELMEKRGYIVRDLCPYRPHIRLVNTFSALAKSSDPDRNRP